jgi:hypothetical protein
MATVADTRATALTGARLADYLNSVAARILRAAEDQSAPRSADTSSPQRR